MCAQSVRINTPWQIMLAMMKMINEETQSDIVCLNVEFGFSCPHRIITRGDSPWEVKFRIVQIFCKKVSRTQEKSTNSDVPTAAWCNRPKCQTGKSLCHAPWEVTTIGKEENEVFY